MPETFAPYDAADYLRSPEDEAAYLNASADDPALFLQAVGTVLRARNITQLSKEAGLSREGVYKAFSGKGNPSFASVMKIIRTLGYDLTVTPPAKPARQTVNA